MQPITSNPIAAQHMRAPDLSTRGNAASAVSVLTDGTPSGNAPPAGNAVTVSAPTTARLKLTADQLTALQSMAAGIPAGSPAEEARAAVAADSQFATVPFGRIVSEFARGAVAPGGNSDTNTSDISNQQSVDGSVDASGEDLTQDAVSPPSDTGMTDTTAGGDSSADAAPSDPIAPEEGSTGVLSESGTPTPDGSTDLSALASADIADAAAAATDPAFTATDPLSSGESAPAA